MKPTTQFELLFTFDVNDLRIKWNYKVNEIIIERPLGGGGRGGSGLVGG